MTWPLLVWRSLRQHALTTVVTAASLALAGGLVMTVWVVKTQAEQAFANTTSGYDAVLGARGSKLQLVLSALFHLEAAPGTVSGEDLAQIRRHPAVAVAVPIAMGDNYRGWRIVGTEPAMFTAVPLADGRAYAVAPGGRMWAEGAREAVVGSFAMERLGWKLGATFTPYHGLTFDPGGAARGSLHGGGATGADEYAGGPRDLDSVERGADDERARSGAGDGGERGVVEVSRADGGHDARHRDQSAGHAHDLGLPDRGGGGGSV